MRHERGFILADAIIALLVCAIAMSAIMTMTVASAQSSQAAEARLTATLIARGLAEDPSVQSENGMYIVDGREYAWEISRERSAVNENTALLVEYISVDVNWVIRSGQSQVTYKTARWEAPNAN